MARNLIPQVRQKVWEATEAKINQLRVQIAGYPSGNIPTYAERLIQGADVAREKHEQMAEYFRLSNAIEAIESSIDAQKAAEQHAATQARLHDVRAAAHERYERNRRARADANRSRAKSSGAGTKKGN